MAFVASSDDGPTLIYKIVQKAMVIKGAALVSV
jgi:hypothetical protein